LDAEQTTDKAKLVRQVVGLDGVNAAGLIDEDGQLRRIHGHAEVFRNGDPVESRDEQASDEDYEDVYLESLGEEFLVVVFGVDEDFEAIKRRVDALCDELVP